MMIDIDFGTIATVALAIGGGFVTMFQHSVSQRIDGVEKHIEKHEKIAFVAIKRIEEDVEVISSQLQHTRENYVTNDRFETRMNDLSKQFEQRAVEVDRKLERIIEKMDGCMVKSLKEDVLMRKVEH